MPDTSGLGALAALLGGGAQQQMPEQDTSGLGGLAALLGGGAPTQQASTGGMGGLSSLLGAVAGAQSNASSPLAPILGALVQKLGLPPAIANIVVSFVLSKLFSGQRGMSADKLGYDRPDLLNRMISTKGVNQTYMRSTGMVRELSQISGMDMATSARSLSTVMNMLGDQASHSTRLAAAAPATTTAHRRRPRGDTSARRTR